MYIPSLTAPGSFSGSIFVDILITSFLLSRSNPFHSRKRLLSLAQLSVKSQGRPKFTFPKTQVSSLSILSVRMSILLALFSHTFIFPSQTKANWPLQLLKRLLLAVSCVLMGSFDISTTWSKQGISGICHCYSLLVQIFERADNLLAVGFGATF